MTQPGHATNTGPGYLEQLQQVGEQSRDLLAELRSELKEVRRQCKALAEERAAAEAMVRGAVEDEIHAAVRAELDKIGPELQQLAHKLYDRVSRETQRLANLAIYGNEQGRGLSIFDEIRQKLEDTRGRL